MLAGALSLNNLKSKLSIKALNDASIIFGDTPIVNQFLPLESVLSIESTDSKGKNWFTIGVSPNIIDASFKALIDSLDFKLFKDKAPASK